MHGVFYNEHEAYAAQWLRNLMDAELIAKGVVDERDIQHIRPDDVTGYHQAHFFAGIAGWGYALQLAGWPAEWPVWTGSCPCQPFSISGKMRGEKDERHLWPVWRGLIAKCRPSIIFGEQVASPLGREWLDGVRADLEALGYEVGAADLCAAGVAAPHIRQRLFWVAVAKSKQVGGAGQSREFPDGGMGLSLSAGLEGHARHVCRGREPGWIDPDTSRSASETSGPGRQSFWMPCDIIGFKDEKKRRIEPGPQQMADGFSERLGRLRPETIKNITKEIADAKLSEKDVRKALQDLWTDYAKKAVQRPPGRCRSIQEAPVLLAFMRELAREGWRLIDHLPPSCWESAEIGLRELRQAKQKASCTPSRWESEQQQEIESSNVVPIMSQIISRTINESWVIPWPLAHWVPARVGKIRAYGNAIVPQIAAVFIAAAIEWIAE